ncbi:hypothetical protein CS022_12370 [Veronia nyctiphanis]|uniref:Lipoprotein n=1 Tax=Veronia nyctiphanis TaxID=1278244 RepID=A0A4V1LSW0_9GAMM|nr:hypothetical protein [Veronia nyctiphanis]RXJ73068.1 hypothetical protein CS022_12370 [Veronia nyctiphanis]
MKILLSALLFSYLLAGCDNQGSSTTPTRSGDTDSKLDNQNLFVVGFSIEGEGSGYFSGNKTLTKSDSAQFKESDSTHIELVVSEHHYIESATGCDGSLTKDGYTISNVIKDCHVDINIKPSVFTITSDKTGQGTISPTSFDLAYGDSKTFTASPNEHHSLASFSGCDGTRNGDKLVVSAITNTCEIKAEFKPTLYKITSSTTGEGAISQ